MSQGAITYDIEIGGVRLPVHTLRGREALSEPFSFLARFQVTGEIPEPDALLATSAALVVSRHGNDERRIDGIVTELRIVATARGVPEVEARVEPRLSLLRHRQDVRVFRDTSAPDIVVEVMQALGVRVERRLSGQYASRPYCVQIRETDLAFVSRLLEDEGIAYFVGDGDVVVLCDAPGSHEPLSGGSVLPFRPGSGLEAQGDAVTAIAEHAELCAGRVSMRDFNPEHPSLDMDVSAAVAGSQGPEHYDYPGEFLSPAEGQQKALRRAESFAAAAAGMAGQSFCPRLAHGFRFDLIDAPLSDTSYLVTAVEHAFDRAASGFSNRFTALEANIPWRPPARTPEPTLTNPMTAFVTGPAGHDIHTDAIGRVKIHFPWDRIQPRDDRSSDWVPVLQDNTGHSVAIPRIGWEVLVHFLEGDPDRPAVLGRLYNGGDTFPESLPEGKTRSALRSLSSPSRDGMNVIRFDDAGGSEQVFVHAERDQNVVVTLDKREDVGENERVLVQVDESRTVGGDETVAVGADRQVVVNANQRHEVAGSRTMEIGAARSSSVGADHRLRIGASHTRRIGSHDAVSAKNIKERVGALILEAAAGDIALAAAKGASFTVGGALVEVARKDKIEQTNQVRAETIGGVLVGKSGKALTASTTGRSITVGGTLKLTAAEALHFDAGTSLRASALLGKLTHPAGITLRSGPSSVTIAGGVVSIKTPGDIMITVSGDNLAHASESVQN